MSLIQGVAHIWRLLTKHPLTRRQPAAAITNRNTIYVKDLEQAQDRLRTVRGFEVPGWRL